MTRISFPYADIKPLDVPERNLLGIFSPSTVSSSKGKEELIEDAFLHPIDSDPLHKRVRGCGKVLVLVDDHTRRSTPVRKIFPRLIRELEAGGIEKENVTILVALGTHRPMTLKKWYKKVGKGYRRTLFCP